MAKMLSVAFGFGIVLILILMFPNITGSIHEADTSNFTDTFLNVTTGVGVSTASVNLTQPLYNNDVKEILAVTSDNTNDLPSSLSYTASTQVYTIKALEANASRNITVLYNTGAVGGFLGISKLLSITPLLIFLAILGIAGLALWYFVLKGKGNG